MADEKKSDDYDMELGEKNGKSFSPPRPVEPIRYTPAPPSSLSSNPVRCCGPSCASSVLMAVVQVLPVISYCASSILM
jgi:hypothetical protein